MKVSNETKVGALTAIAITIFILGFSFLKGNNLFTNSRMFYVVYEKTPGLKTSGQVLYNGVMIGRVKEKYLKEDNSGLVMVRIELTSDIPLPNDTHAKIVSSDLLGDKSIELLPGTSPTMAQPRDTLIGDIQSDLTEEIRQELAPITARVQSMIGQVDTAIQIIGGLFGGDTPANLDRSLNSVSATLATFERTASRIDLLVANQSIAIDSTFSNIVRITDAIADNEQNIRDIIHNLKSVSDSLAQVNFAQSLASAKDALDGLSSIVSDVESGQGSLGKLLKDEELYTNLNDASASLDRLINELNENPRKFVPPIIQIGGKKQK